MLKTPKAPKKAHTQNVGQESWQDPYFWMRNKDDPDTMAYIKSENAYTDAFFAADAAAKEGLYQEMRARIQEKDSSVPQAKGAYVYFSKFGEGEQYPTYVRKPADGGDEEVLLNLNKLAEGKSYLDLGAFEVSPDDKLLAYSIDSSGDETYELFVLEIASGRFVHPSVKQAYSDVSWANDSKHFFYTELDAQLRPLKVYRECLGETDRVLVYEEKDPRFFLGVSRTLSGKLIIIHAEGSHTSEEYFVSADAPLRDFTCIEPRRDNVEYNCVEKDGALYRLTNAEGARDFQIVRRPLEGEKEWVPFIPHRAGRLLTSVEAFSNHLVVESMEGALPKIHIYPDGKPSKEVAFDEAAYWVQTGGYREFETTTLRYHYQSFTTPLTVFDYDMVSGEKTLRKETPVLGGFNKENYESKRELATAADGTQIPVSIVYRKGNSLPGPLVLDGYGSYGLSRSATFSSSRLSLLDRGFTYAIPHIRGGMELGWDWYEQGKLLKKKNTFGDFIASAKHLVEKGYTKSGEIVAVGGSAGGMLMGVVANESPSLFRAIVAHVPFVDVLNTMLDESLTLTPIEFKEWGNPKEKTYFEYIRSYSPYDNVKQQSYPAMLVTAGLNDPRVTYWEPAKWVAKLRELKTDNHPLLLRTNMGAGHGGASGRFEYLKEIAEEYLFVLKAFGKSL